MLLPNSLYALKEGYRDMIIVQLIILKFFKSNKLAIPIYQ